MYAQKKKCRPFEFNLFGKLLRPACPGHGSGCASVAGEPPGWLEVSASFDSKLRKLFGRYFWSAS